MKTAIASVLAWEALDSRGRPTVACSIRLEGGAEAEALAPSGASTGTHEALELRDGGERHGGRGVLRAVAHVNGPIAEAIRGLDAADLGAVDRRLKELDGSPQLSNLGGNAAVAVSLASCRVAAAAAGVPLYRLFGERPLIPMPMVNILSGGLHAGGLVDVQDYLAVPLGAGSFAEAMEGITRIRAAAAEVVGERGGTPALVADEGGLALALRENREGVEVLTRAIERAGFRPREDVGIAIDVAATSLYRDGAYQLAAEGRSLSTGEMADLVAGWARDFPIVSIEDPLAEDDWEGWPPLTERLAGLQVLGDDFFVTSAERLRRGIDACAANAILIKPNQNGTVSGTHEVVRLAQAAGYATVVSARSGETEDSTIADLATGWRAGQIKVGSTTRSERTAKWNRLLRIEAELGPDAEFAGRSALAPLK